MKAVTIITGVICPDNSAMQTSADGKLLCQAFISLLYFFFLLGEGQTAYTFRTENFPPTLPPSLCQLLARQRSPVLNAPLTTLASHVLSLGQLEVSNCPSRSCQQR